VQLPGAQAAPFAPIGRFAFCTHSRHDTMPL
jgi:hypothetical protein